MPVEFKCLEDCDADCCACPIVDYQFSLSEAEMLKKAGSNIVNSGRGYLLYSCAYLDINNHCTLHGRPKQPECCKNTQPGSFTCLQARDFNGRYP